MKKINGKTLVIELLESALVGFSIFFVITVFIGQIIQVSGESMAPTLQDKEQLFAEKLSIKTNPIKRGDILIFEDPNDKQHILIKRVVGLPGELLEIKDGSVYINNEKLTEDYTKGETLGKILDTSILVPQDHYFMLGDNRENSSDSRYFGAVSTDKIQSKAVMIFLPVWNFRLL